MGTLKIGKIRPVSKGDWTSTGDAYEALDIVKYNGGAWFCIKDCPAAYEPDSHPTYWASIAEKGDTGPQGEQGVQGVAGVDGVNGINGETGPQGAQGAIGPMPNHVWNETRTAVKFQQSDGTYGTYSEDFTGPQGVTGEQGVQGIQGEKGAKGDTGATGKQGVQGEKGDTGATGPMPALSTSVTSTSEVVAASSSAVKTAYDKAVSALSTATTANSVASAALPSSSYTAKNVLDKLKTVDGSGSGIDADMLDGNHASSFLKAGDDGHLKNLELRWAGGTPFIYFINDETINYDTRIILESDDVMNITGAELHANGSKVWHAGNDGAGSGLDADKLDGYEASAFLTSAKKGSVDLNTLVDAGCYYIGSGCTNGPNSSDVSYASVIMIRGTSSADTGAQILINYQSTEMWMRVGVDLLTSGAATWRTWRQVWTSYNFSAALAPLPNGGSWVYRAPSQRSIPNGGTWAYFAPSIGGGILAGGTKFNYESTYGILCWRIA